MVINSYNHRRFWGSWSKSFFLLWFKKILLFHCLFDLNFNLRFNYRSNFLKFDILSLFCLPRKDELCVLFEVLLELLGSFSFYALFFLVWSNPLLYSSIIHHLYVALFALTEISEVAYSFSFMILKASHNQLEQLFFHGQTLQGISYHLI